jgi:hypothetical protein
MQAKIPDTDADRAIPGSRLASSLVTLAAPAACGGHIVFGCLAPIHGAPVATDNSRIHATLLREDGETFDSTQIRYPTVCDPFGWLVDPFVYTGVSFRRPRIIRGFKTERP